MRNYFTITPFQKFSLVFLRIIIGWHFLYEGIVKVLSSGWSAESFLKESQWFMTGFAEWAISHPQVLKVIDLMNIWGLILIGIALIIGFFTKPAAWAGVLLMLLYYFNNAPLIGMEYSIPNEGNVLIVSKTLIEAVALFVVAVFPTGKMAGLDMLISNKKINKIL